MADCGIWTSETSELSKSNPQEFQEGRDACRDNDGFNPECPYAKGTQEQAAWSAGWNSYWDSEW